MTEATGNYLVAGKQIVPVADIHDYVLDKDDTIYEVLRMIASKPLFLEEHIDRFIHSFLLRQKDIASYRQHIINGIKLLMKHNDMANGNIRYQFNNNDIRQFRAWFIPAQYPTQQQYTEGVTVMTFEAARHDPNVKARNIQLRKDTDLFIHQHNISEAILVNEQGYLTEGSRSNIFFIYKDIFVTPPLPFVLPGVTRQKVIGLIRDNHMKIEEKIIRPEDAEHYAACFITGTSAKILPVSFFNHLKTDTSNKWLLKISGLYNTLCNNYLENFQWPEL